jgi:hypothetical protein
MDENDYELSEYKLTRYFEKIGLLVQNILERPEKSVLTYDILDTETSRLNKLITLHLFTFQTPIFNY